MENGLRPEKLPLESPKTFVYQVLECTSPGRFNRGFLPYCRVAKTENRVEARATRVQLSTPRSRVEHRPRLWCQDGDPKLPSDGDAAKRDRRPPCRKALSSPRVTARCPWAWSAKRRVQVRSVGFPYRISGVARADPTAVGAQFIEAAVLSVKRLRQRAEIIGRPACRNFLQGAVSAQTPAGPVFVELIFWVIEINVNL